MHFLRQLRQLDRIHTVVIDLWRPYREAAQLILPGAAVVADKFHVLKLATTALEQLRKEISRSLTETQRKTLKMHDRYAAPQETRLEARRAVRAGELD